MFCTRRAELNPGMADVCSGCGAVLARSFSHAARHVDALSARPPRRKVLWGIVAAPVAVPLLLGALLATRQ